MAKNTLLVGLPECTEGKDLRNFFREVAVETFLQGYLHSVYSVTGLHLNTF